MSNLRETQENMQAYVLEKDLTVADAVASPVNMTAEQRLNVYRNAYYLRLTEILVSDFSILQKMMGPKAFAAMCRDYLDAYPSHHFSVRPVGRHLAKFLKNKDGVAPEFSELAEFEWGLNKTLFTKDAPVLTLAEMGQIPPDQWAEMTLVLNPSIQTRLCYYNTGERWQAFNKSEVDIGAVKLDKPLWHLIWRYEYEAYFCTITDTQYALLSAIQRGEPFANLCESMLEYFTEEEVVAWVATTLQGWVNEGLFSGVLVL